MEFNPLVATRIGDKFLLGGVFSDRINYFIDPKEIVFVWSDFAESEESFIRFVENNGNPEQSILDTFLGAPAQIIRRDERIELFTIDQYF